MKRKAPDKEEVETIFKEVTKHQTVKRKLDTYLTDKQDKEKIKYIVNICTHLHQWTLYFLNWYALTTGNEYYIGSGQNQTYIAGIVRCFLGRNKFRNKTLKTYLPIIQEFIDKYPKSRIDDSLCKIHYNTLNFLVSTIKTNIKLYHKELESQKFYTKKLDKLNKYREDKISMSFSDSSLFHNLLEFNNQTVETELSDIKPYPMPCFGEIHVKFDRDSLNNYFEKNIDQMLTNTIKSKKTRLFSTNGYDASVYYQCNVQKKFSVKHLTNKKSKKLFDKYESLDEQIMSSDNFDRVRKLSKIPDLEHFTRNIFKLSKQTLVSLREEYKDEQLVYCDPGKRKIYSALDAFGNQLEFSSDQRDILTMKEKYEKNLKRITEPIQDLLDQLSQKNRFLDYLDFVHDHLETFRRVYSHSTLKKWNFRRFGLKQKMYDSILRHLVDSVEPRKEFYQDDKKRKKQKVGRLKNKRVICWGNGSNGHNRGCQPVPNKLLLYHFSKRTPILLINEFNTSKLCHKCHNELSKEALTPEGERIKSCTTCHLDLDRDVNAALNIKQVTLSYLNECKAPIWNQIQKSINDINESLKT